jgi:glycosyltransferase involved in cell wall biosynthesis
MTNFNKTLSICIPTYNRVDELEKNIINLIPICKELDIEIIISDNNSDDMTCEVVNNCIILYDKIKYYKLESNRGIDYNINNVITKATSDYCWLLGDDDSVFNNALITILYFINEFNPDFLLLNCEERDIVNNNLLRPRFFNLENEFDFISPDVLMSKFSGIMTLLSACVVKRENWEKVLLEEYNFKYYFHMYNVFKSLKNNSRVIVVDKPLFVRYSGNMWKFDRSDFNDILHYYYPMTIESSGINYEFKYKLSGIKMKIRKVNIGTFLRLRGKNLCRFDLFPRCYFFLMRYHLIIAIFVLFLPSNLSKFVYHFGLKIFNRDE